jgi:hypothetical protein
MTAHWAQGARRAVQGLAAFGLLALAAGCVPFQADIVPPQGGLFTDIQAPITTNFTGNPVSPDLIKASSSQTYYLNTIFWGDVAWDEAAIAEIARKGGIDRVSYADYEFFQILGVFAKFTVNVYGESDSYAAAGGVQ